MCFSDFQVHIFEWFLCPNCICMVCLPVLAMSIRRLVAFMYRQKMILNSRNCADENCTCTNHSNHSHVISWIAHILLLGSINMYARSLCFRPLQIKVKRGNIAIICTVFKFVAEVLRQMIDSSEKWLWWAIYLRIHRKGATILHYSVLKKYKAPSKWLWVMWVKWWVCLPLQVFITWNNDLKFFLCMPWRYMVSGEILPLILNIWLLSILKNLY
jgi:hypothetical protein